MNREIVVFDTYAELREEQWKRQSSIDPHIHLRAYVDGDKFNFPVLYPKRALFLHDTWMFQSWSALTAFLQVALTYQDLNSVQTKGRTILMLDYDLPPGGTHMLPGQEEQTRVN